MHNTIQFYIHTFFFISNEPGECEYIETLDQSLCDNILINFTFAAFTCSMIATREKQDFNKSPDFQDPNCP